MPGRNGHNLGPAGRDNHGVDPRAWFGDDNQARNRIGAGPMNKHHLEMLSSPRWAEMLERDLLPWVTTVTDLGDEALEVGPGPGLTTDLLRTRTARLTAVEIDPVLAESLTQRLAGTNVVVVNRN